MVIPSFSQNMLAKNSVLVHNFCYLLTADTSNCPVIGIILLNTLLPACDQFQAISQAFKLTWINIISGKYVFPQNTF